MFYLCSNILVLKEEKKGGKREKKEKKVFIHPSHKVKMYCIYFT